MLFDAFLVAYFDARWRDRTRAAGLWDSALAIEQQILRNALIRAARG